MAAGDLTTLEAVKRYMQLGADETDVEPSISALITSESKAFIALTDMPILSATYSETRNGDGSRVFFPKNKPITSVQSVVIDRVTIPDGSAAADGAGWYLIEQSRIELVGYFFTARVLPGCFPYSQSVSTGVANVTVSYTAGYASVPEDVAQAVNEMVAIKLKGRDRIGLLSQSVGGETVSYQVLSRPTSIDDTIARYKRLSF
jgi:hypothetical protein